MRANVHHTTDRGLVGRSIHDAPDDSHVDADIAAERAHEAAKSEVMSYLLKDHSDVMDELIPELDAKGMRALHMTILIAHRGGCPYARELIDALAVAEADREAQL